MKDFTVVIKKVNGNTAQYNGVHSWRSEGPFLSIKMANGIIHLVNNTLIDTAEIQ